MRDFEVDLESGCSVSGDDYSSEETFSGFKEHAKAMVAKVCSRFIDGSIQCYQLLDILLRHGP